MTPQAKIKARLKEFAGADDIKISVRNRKGAFYAVLWGHFNATYTLIRRVLPQASMTSGAGPEATFRLWPETAIKQMLGEMEVEPAWLTGTVVSLARGIRESGAFERLPVLADALEEAGCTSTAMLTHCRASPSHCRSCWVVDVLLGG